MVWVDKDALTLKVGGVLGVTARVEETRGRKALVTTWGEDFSGWRELQESKELAGLKTKAEEMLSGGPGGKGWSKGKYQ